MESQDDQLITRDEAIERWAYERYVASMRKFRDDFPTLDAWSRYLNALDDALRRRNHTPSYSR